MKVCKFGGSSLADAAQVNKVIDIVLADPARRIVVVSAPGKRHSGDTKVTDLLIALAETALKGDNTDREFGEVAERYASMADALKLGDGIVKLIIDREHRNVIGVHMIGNYASEIIYGAAMMVEKKMRVENVKKMVFPHPSVCEVIREGIFQI